MRPQARRARRALCLALTATGIGVAAAGCGSESSGAGVSEAEPLGQERGGSTAFLAQCSDWVDGTDAAKLATVEEIRSQVNREDAGVTASALDDERAVEVLDAGCDKPYAAGYRLHILYARAAAFEPLRRIAEGEAAE